jgi:hypothetical protein
MKVDDGRWVKCLMDVAAYDDYSGVGGGRSMAGRQQHLQE